LTGGKGWEEKESHRITPSAVLISAREKKKDRKGALIHLSFVKRRGKPVKKVPSDHSASPT